MKFFEYYAFNVIGDARFLEPGKNAGDLWGELGSVDRVNFWRIEIYEDRL